MYGSEKIFLIDELSEMTIGKSYAKYFSEKWGAVKAMHWIPSVLPNDTANNSLYFCKDMKTTLSQTITSSLLIKNGLLTRNCHPPKKNFTQQKNYFFRSLIFSNGWTLVSYTEAKHVKGKLSRSGRLL